jgi:CheY-like chemotaxis protein
MDEGLFREISGEGTSATGADIVIAEDDPYISRMYELKLALKGKKIAVASDGKEALEIIKANHPKLVLMDIYMPELNGFEVIDALSGAYYNMKKTKFVFLTNSTYREDKLRAKKLGYKYLIKADLTPTDVIGVIESELAN